MKLLVTLGFKGSVDNGDWFHSTIFKNYWWYPTWHWRHGWNHHQALHPNLRFRSQTSDPTRIFHLQTARQRPLFHLSWNAHHGLSQDTSNSRVKLKQRKRRRPYLLFGSLVVDLVGTTCRVLKQRSPANPPVNHFTITICGLPVGPKRPEQHALLLLQAPPCFGPA